MALDRESIEITSLLHKNRQLHRYVYGVDIEEDVFRSRYIAAGLEGIVACSSDSESGIALFLLFVGTLDYSELGFSASPPEPLGPFLFRTELARSPHDAKKKNN